MRRNRSSKRTARSGTSGPVTHQALEPAPASMPHGVLPWGIDAEQAHTDPGTTPPDLDRVPDHHSNERRGEPAGTRRRRRCPRAAQHARQDDEAEQRREVGMTAPTVRVRDRSVPPPTMGGRQVFHDVGSARGDETPEPRKKCTPHGRPASRRPRTAWAPGPIIIGVKRHIEAGGVMKIGGYNYGAMRVRRAIRPIVRGFHRSASGRRTFCSRRI